MKKYVVYREVTAIYGTIVEADSEEDAYELVDDENNKTDSENPERKLKVVKWKLSMIH